MTLLAQAVHQFKFYLFKGVKQIMETTKSLIYVQKIRHKIEEGVTKKVNVKSNKKKIKHSVCQILSVHRQDMRPKQQRCTHLNLYNCA